MTCRLARTVVRASQDADTANFGVLRIRRGHGLPASRAIVPLRG